MSKNQGVQLFIRHISNDVGVVSTMVGQGITYQTNQANQTNNDKGAISAKVVNISGAISSVGGKVGGTSGMIQVGVTLYRNDGNVTKLTTGDLLTIGASVASLIPGGQLVAAVFAIGGVVYSIYESKHGPVTVGDIGDYWHERLSFEPYENLNRDGKYHLYDPLVLDLNGNGIETIGHNKIYGTLFDHDGDGIKTATGWIKPTDGLLVLDKDHNGNIDSGRELFGDATLLKNGLTALNGFAALAELDSNGDGKISAEDELFEQLKVWQDLNADGIVQEGELKTLTELGITALNLTHEETAQNLGNGNRLTHIGSFEKADGSSGKMGDVDLASNPLFSRYTDTLPMTAEQAAAPNLHGVGRLRDLREAAVLSEKLGQTLQAYTAADTKAAQLALLDNLMLEWAQTDPFFHASAFSVSPAFIKTQNEGIALTPSQAQAMELMVIPPDVQEQLAAPAEKAAVLNAFSGQKSAAFYYASVAQAREIGQVIEETYARLGGQIYRALLLQTRFKPYLDEIVFNWDGENLSVDYSGLTALFEKIHADNAQKAFVDLGEFLVFGGADNWQEGRELFTGFVQAARISGDLPDYLAQLGHDAVQQLAAQNGTDSDDTLKAIGLLNQDVLNGRGGDDVLIAGSAPSVLDGGAGSDRYVFADGFGTSEIHNRDTGAQRSDSIDLSAFESRQVRFFRQGDDLMVQVENQNSIIVKNMFAGEVLVNHIDQIITRDKIITLAQIKEEILRGTDGGETIIGFSDDDEIHAGAGNDVIESKGGNDVIYAGSGNNRIDAGAGNDVIYLGSGDNWAYGGDDDDVIYSGTGNDHLEGGIGSDKYIFRGQFGRDEILNFNPQHKDTDTLVFGEIYSKYDLLISRENYDLILKQWASKNQVVVKNFFEQDGYSEFAIQKIELGSGETYDIPEIIQWSQRGTLLSDDVYALDAGSVLNTGHGHDFLRSGKGNDQLNGGHGRDIYIYRRGGGHDKIHDIGGQDTLILKDIRAEEIWFSRTGKDLTLNFIEHKEDSITIEGWYIGKRIESIQTEKETLDWRKAERLEKQMSRFDTEENTEIPAYQQMAAFNQNHLENQQYWVGSVL